ncbi:ribonuclease H-like domain-containing protein [Durotheca rogersii]|uniref:ribonuclease H-like domain-containing protein n=1 Tax=Durotheca rogersii TaxID=419775 RepID=UPI0022203DEB|nr:ribonuclease H-like domain-containing protein [Durotheca rogersii]KAI5857363.1 ribonuclease H-like domain-containing protein [Durotheca rogersii]
MINTRKAMSSLLGVIETLPLRPPSLFLDMEGPNLGRRGSISIMQLCIPRIRSPFLIDITTLGMDAFTTPGQSGSTLKAVLESKYIPKVIFDVRSDSDALYALYNIKLAGVDDLQLMELGSRSKNRTTVNGLSKCISAHLTLDDDEMEHIKAVKLQGAKLFAPELGGNYEVFNERPLPKAIQEYCELDVRYLSRLWDHYHKKLSPMWKLIVAEETERRIALTQTEDFDGYSPELANAPPGWGNRSRRIHPSLSKTSEKWKIIKDPR